MRMLNISVLILLLICGIIFSEPMLQVGNYSIIPQDVYPGTSGYAMLTINNVGDATASSAATHYHISGPSETVDSIGDISSMSSTQVLVPFEIHQQAGTIQVLSADIYYVYAGTNSMTSKKTSIAIPLTIKQLSPLEVSTVSMDNKDISAGEKLAFDLAITNSGGMMDNLILTMPANSTFSIEGSSQKTVGSIPSNSTVKVPLTLVSSSDTKTGTYAVPVVFTYQDTLKQPTNQTFGIGPINVLSSSSKYRLGLEPQEPVEIGSDIAFKLTLQNTGSSPVSGIVDINMTSIFTPLGTQRIYFDSVPAGATVSKDVKIGVSSSASSGYYTLPLRLTPNAGQPTEYDAGIMVEATPEITVSLDSQSASPQIQVANTGNSQIRSVYVSAKAAGSQAPVESFIGTLNVDDFASVALNADSAGRNVDVVIRFRDSNNQEQSVTKTLQPQGNSSFVQQGARTSGASGRNLTGRQGGPLGMLLGPGGAASGGPDLVTIGIAALVILVGAGYLLFLRFGKGKAKK